MIPEDSTLRRHYLTELKYKRQRETAVPDSIPFLHFVSAGFFVLLLFILF
jgi:hypothetical protein